MRIGGRFGFVDKHDLVEHVQVTGKGFTKGLTKSFLGRVDNFRQESNGFAQGVDQIFSSARRQGSVFSDTRRGEQAKLVEISYEPNQSLRKFLCILTEQVYTELGLYLDPSKDHGLLPLRHRRRQTCRPSSNGCLV